MSDGGNLELDLVKGNEVIVSFQGACGSCSISNQTLNNVILRALQEDIHPQIEVKKI